MTITRDGSEDGDTWFKSEECFDNNYLDLSFKEAEIIEKLIDYKNQGKKSSDIISVSFLSQCMISLLLHKPDYARARPSTLLTNDETYRELYIDNQDLDVFYHAAKLGRMIDSYLKQSNLYTLAQINDLLFYVLYCSVVCKVGKTNLSAQDIKSLDMNSFSRDYLLDIARRTFNCYTEIGGTSKIAKGPELIKLLRFKFDTGAF